MDVTLQPPTFCQVHNPFKNFHCETVVVIFAFKLKYITFIEPRTKTFAGDL